MPWVAIPAFGIVSQTMGPGYGYTNISMNQIPTGYIQYSNQTLTSVTQTLGIYPNRYIWVDYATGGGGGLILNTQSVFIPEPIPILSHRVEPRPRAPETYVADEKAKTLLFSQLTEEQRKSFVESGWFLVLSKRSGRQYRVHVSHLVANVTRLEDGARLCAHCDPSLPRADHLLAQKLMLEYDEEAFLQVANRH